MISHIRNKYGLEVEDYRDDSMIIEAKNVVNEIYQKSQDGVDAWISFINKYFRFIGGDFCVEYTINEVIKRLISKYHGKQYDVIIDKILPIIMTNDRLMELLFQYAGCGVEISYKPKLLACLIVSDKYESVYKVMSYLCNNKNMIFISVGGFLCETYKYVDEILGGDSYNGIKKDLSQNMKTILWDSLKLCYSAFDMAECKIPIICMIDHK